MAQDIIEKIRAAAHASKINPDVAVKIAYNESGLIPTSKDPNSNAGGLFGILGSSWDYNGGRPGMLLDPDENIRVGTKIIASNTNHLRGVLGREPTPAEIYTAHFFGPGGAQKFLAASPETSGLKVLGQKVIDSNPQLKGLNVGQIRQMLEKKMGGAAPTAPIKTTPASAPAAAPARTPGLRAEGEDLGSGYKAALALSFLGSEDHDKPESDADLQARLDREEEDRQAQEFADYKPYNALKDLQLSASSHLKHLFPQAEAEPVHMAAGGLPFTPTAQVKGTAREELDAIKAQYDKYNADADAYNAALNKYKTEQYDPYIAAVQKYNDAATAWNAGPRTTAFGMTAPTAPADFSMTAPTAPTVSQADYEAKGAAAQADTKNRQLAISAAEDPERFGLTINKFFADGGEADKDQKLMADIPEQSNVNFIRSAHKQRIGDKDIENMMVGLGIDKAALGLNLSNMRQGDKNNLAQSLMAAYNDKIGDVGVNAAVMRPANAPPGTYTGNLTASYPVGEGRVMAGVNAMRTPEGHLQTMGNMLGYSGPVGPGHLNATVMQPKGNPQGRQYQMQYSIPFADGGSVQSNDLIGQNLPYNPNPMQGTGAVMMSDGGEVPTPMLISVPLYAETVSHEMYPGQGGQFDQKDAARHMLAAGTLQRKYGDTAAEMLGNLHEIKTSPFRWLGSKLGISEMPVDYEQDLHNNKVGIELAKRAKSQRELEDLVNMEAERAKTQQTPGTAWIGKPVRRADGSPEQGEIGFFNPNIQRQGAKARALAQQRDVNTLPDPKTYAAVSGLLGTPPDQMGFSVLHPQYKEIQKVAEPAFMAGTALQIAPVAAPVMKGLGKMAGSALNERMLAGQSLTPGFNTPAPINFAVRPRGGPYLLQPTGRGYKDPVTMALAETQSSRDPSLSKWFNDKFGAYMRRDMGSPDDQFVKAADEGRPLHFAIPINKSMTVQEAIGEIPYGVAGYRRREGFTPEGEAHTAYGKLVESKIDLPIGPVKAEELLSGPDEQLIPLSMRKSAIADPSQRFYELDPWISRELKLEEMHDFMADMRQGNGVLTKYGQKMAIPKEYQFTDSALQGLTPAQASERVALAQRWMTDNTQRLASKAVSSNPQLVSHTYDNGSKWASFPDLAEHPDMLKLVQDVGCDGGWCTNKESFAMMYGSEDGKRLNVLFDNKGRPKAQITVQQQVGKPIDFMDSLGGDEYNAFLQSHPKIARVLESDNAAASWQFDATLDDIAETPEFKRWKSQQGTKITEIKGFDNQRDIANAPYLKEVQDFVKRTDREQNLQAVENLDGIGMRDLSGMIWTSPTVQSRPPMGLDKIKALENEVVKLNSGSRFIEDNPNMIEGLIEKGYNNLFGAEGHATGGMIERKKTDNRRYL